MPGSILLFIPLVPDIQPWERFPVGNRRENSYNLGVTELTEYLIIRRRRIVCANIVI